MEREVLMERESLTCGFCRVGDLWEGCSPSVFSFLQIMLGATQEKLSPLSFLKMGNQVQPGGAGEEWAGPEGGGPISRVEGTGGVAVRLRPEGEG